jgi:gliding motility-associated-like protein
VRAILFDPKTVDTIKTTITIKPDSKPDLGSDSTLPCNVATYILRTGTSGHSYKWQDGNTDSTFIARKSGLYWVDVTNAGGCTARDSVKLTFQSSPQINFGPDTLACEGDSLLINATFPQATYLWNDSSTAPIKPIREPGKYSVQVTNQCGTASASREVEFQDCRCYLYIPDAFSPNGDVLDEAFLPSACPTKEYQFSIYNRWGECIFETTNIAQGWDGTYLGRRAPEGMYLYMIRLRDHWNKTQYRTGTISLIR